MSELLVNQYVRVKPDWKETLFCWMPPELQVPLAGLTGRIRVGPNEDGMVQILLDRGELIRIHRDGVETGSWSMVWVPE